MSPTDKSRRIKHLAADLGFDHVGIAPTASVRRSEYLRTWLDAGRAGAMAYLHRNHAIRIDPRRLLDQARSVIVVAMNYRQQEPEQPNDGPPRGRVAMYAWGDDYHDVLKRRLHLLVDRMRLAIDEPFETRCCVDTAPILEREWAEAAGIGWIGKNTMVLNQGLGSYFFLGEVVTTLELAYDEPLADHCGRCTRCLEACPTGAFPAAYEMDASKCISYLTIEHRGDIPDAFHAPMGDWIFGCDICQQVCPYNHAAPLTDVFAVRPPGPTPLLQELLSWSSDEYRRTLKGSAMKRATPEMLQRNAGIALRNASRDSSSQPITRPSPQEVPQFGGAKQGGEAAEDQGSRGHADRNFQ